MKEAVDLGTTRKLIGVHLVPGAFNALLKVHTKLLHHPDEGHMWLCEYPACCSLKQIYL